MLHAIAATLDETALNWAVKCCLLAWAWYALAPIESASFIREGDKNVGILRQRKSAAQRFEGGVRVVEALQAGYVGLSAVRHLLAVGGPLPVLLIQRMAGYLWFDTCYECVLPFVKGTSLSLPFLVHHLVGLAAHGLAKTHGPLRAVTAHVYLAELSTPFLHKSWFLKQGGRAESSLYVKNGAVGALMYVIFRVCWPPLFVYWNRDPAPWEAEQAGVHSAFLACSGVFWCLNLFWFTKLVAMARGSKREKQA